MMPFLSVTQRETKSLRALAPLHDLVNKIASSLSTSHRAKQFKQTLLLESFIMEQHQDLAGKLAPHLHALSTTSTAILNPLTSVLTTLISELASLRAAHDQLHARVSHFEIFNQVSLPHSIPPPPTTTPPESPTIDPELTQPPPPLHYLPQSEIDHPSPRPPSEQINFERQPLDSEAPPLPTTSHITPRSSPKKRLRRKRRSSKRPMSYSATSSGRTQNHTPASDQTITPAKTPTNAHQLKSANSSMFEEPVTPRVPPILHNSDGQSIQVPHVKLEPQEEKIRTMKVLPTTPTTDEKTKKRKTDPLTNDPVIEGYMSVAAAVRVAESIVANRDAENCPPAFRSDAHLGKTCKQCQNLFRARAAEAVDPQEAFQALLKDGCSHQEKISGPRTPEGYWALDFSETPTQSPPQNLVDEH